MLSKTENIVRSCLNYIRLPVRAKLERFTDTFGPPSNDPAIEEALEVAIDWLCRAQDNSASSDGGVARHYSLIDGWASSYPETTGYIVPTLLTYSRLFRKDLIRNRAKDMLDWLTRIQMQQGAFQGSTVGHKKSGMAVAFNTGQILLGLAEGVREFGDRYSEPAQNAAAWLVRIQDNDGCWRKFESSNVKSGEKTYHTHIAWGLFEAARVLENKIFPEAALKNINWALRFQHKNGWFQKCCLSDPLQPLTHTIGYTLRGIVEAYRYTQDKDLLEACCRSADGLITAIDMETGWLPGRLDSNWKGTVSWSCLTGSLQISICLLLLYNFTGNKKYRAAAYAANRFVRRTMKIKGPDQIRGGIKGSYPVNGGYGAYQYLNWACKFFIDASLLELGQRNILNLPDDFK